MEISHHGESEDGGLKQTKLLVFVLDEIDKVVKQEGKKGRKKAVECTVRNFGSFVSIPALKEASAFTLAWRCRLPGSMP